MRPFPPGWRKAALCLALLSLSALARASLPTTVKICEGEEEWPPFTYFSRVNGKAGTEVTGFSVDFVKLLLAKKGIAATIDMIPWKRCQQEVADGRYDMLLNATENEERERLYWVSDAYYQLTGIAFYASSRTPPRLDKLEDLRRYKICGIRGYTYDNYGLSVGQVDQGSANVAMAMGKLLLDRCDLFLNNREIMAGMHAIGAEDYLRDPHFAYLKVPGLHPPRFHMMISRKPPYALELKTLIDKGIRDMEKSGVAERLRKRYLE
ncbi:substrate-binding periplasmic protein [Chromobacterium alticapitis]|nr:transporter substrate-binding domain-containing protein [Chromobacterium alticapitis]